METNEQPASNLLTDFKCARTLLKTSSRGKNPDWYREAVSLEQQLHLFETAQSGGGFLSFLLDLKSQETTPLNPLPGEPDSEALASYLDYLQAEILPAKTRSLGVVLHLRREASVFDFPLPVGEEVDFKALQQEIAVNPAGVLKDRTLTEGHLSFRIFPTPAAPHAGDFGTAVAMTARGETLLAAFRALGRERNFPIRTHGLASPLLLMARLPRTLGQDQESPFCVMLRYCDFSFFGFFTAGGELILLRSLKHNEAQLPHNLESILTTTAASIELASLSVKAYDCRLEKGVSLEGELTPLFLTVPFCVEVLSERGLGVPPRREEEEDSLGRMPKPLSLETLPLELSTYLLADDAPDLAFAETETFGPNLKENYHLQNFLEVPAAERDAFPGAIDMKLLRIGRLLTRTGLAACLLLTLFAAAIIFRQTTSVQWKSAKVGKAQAATVAKRLREVRGKEKLLADRSKGWVAMEVFSRLFPHDGSVRFGDASYQVSTTDSKETSGATAGLVRSWTVQGFAKEGVIDQLVKLNSIEGMTEVFEEVEAATASGSLDLSQKTRNLLVDMKFSENKGFEPGARRGAIASFQNQFTLDIKQRIEKGDPLAIPVTQL
jgi:hypothetical protein